MTNLIDDDRHDVCLSSCDIAIASTCYMIAEVTVSKVGILIFVLKRAQIQAVGRDVLERYLYVYRYT